MRLTDEIRVSGDALAFIQAMDDADRWDGQLVYFLEKPWKWDDEFALWLNNGKPTDPASPDWEQWLRLLDDR